MNIDVNSDTPITKTSQFLFYKEKEKFNNDLNWAREALHDYRRITNEDRREDVYGDMQDFLSDNHADKKSKWSSSLEEKVKKEALGYAKIKIIT
jgi:hypothetical protein